MTMDKIIEELDNTVRLPGLANVGCQLSNRIDMLSTGIKSPIGIKVSDAMLADIDTMWEQIEEVARTVPGVASALTERLEGGRYIALQILVKKPRVTV